MNDAIFTAKRRLSETEAMWSLALGSLYQAEKNEAFRAYAEAVKDTSARLAQAIDDYLGTHPVSQPED